jgi:hypothetical protein
MVAITPRLILEGVIDFIISIPVELLFICCKIYADWQLIVRAWFITSGINTFMITVEDSRMYRQNSFTFIYVINLLASTILMVSRLVICPTVFVIDNYLINNYFIDLHVFGRVPVIHGANPGHSCVRGGGSNFCTTCSNIDCYGCRTWKSPYVHGSSYCTDCYLELQRERSRLNNIEQADCASGTYCFYPTAKYFRLKKWQQTAVCNRCWCNDVNQNGRVCKKCLVFKAWNQYSKGKSQCKSCKRFSQRLRDEKARNELVTTVNKSDNTVISINQYLFNKKHIVQQEIVKWVMQRNKPAQLFGRTSYGYKCWHNKGCGPFGCLGPVDHNPQNSVILHFDHILPLSKSMNISNLHTLQQALEELPKTQLLSIACHRMKTFAAPQLAGVKQQMYLYINAKKRTMKYCANRPSPLVGNNIYCLEEVEEGKEFLFDFDHIVPANKTFNIAYAVMWNAQQRGVNWMNKIENEITNHCQLLCCHCHARKTLTELGGYTAEFWYTYYFSLVQGNMDPPIQVEQDEIKI